MCVCVCVCVWCVCVVHTIWRGVRRKKTMPRSLSANTFARRAAHSGNLAADHRRYISDPLSLNGAHGLALGLLAL